MMNFARRRSFAPLLLLASTAAGCSSAAEALISPEQENMLGAQVKLELEKGSAEMPAIRYLPPSAVRTYLLGLADKVVALGKMQRPEFTWNVEIIDDSNQVNAFATPGGYLYVFTGLAKAAENEAELIGVMGHEVAHVLARHYAQRLVRTYGLQALIAAALGENAGVLSQLAATIAAQGYLLSHSREAETEADEIGARLTSQAGYDPNGLATFFAKLEAMRGSTPAVLKYLMGHPLPGDRQKHITEVIMREKLMGNMTNAAMFQQMKTMIPNTPPPANLDGGVRD